MMKKCITLTAFLVAVALINAQGPADALMYSRTYSGGTARYNAMSGAFGALGGDFSTLSSNPAGIGVYRTSEFVLTTGINFTENITESLGNEAADRQSSMNLGNLGYVGTWRSGASTGLISLNWGIGVNRLQDFNRNSHYQTNSNSSSLTDVMRAEAIDDGLNPSDFEDKSIWSKSSKWRNVMGWDTYLIDYNGGVESPYNSILLAKTAANQDKFVAERGSVNEWAFSFGGNVNHMLYFGATLGLQSLYYTKHTRFDETFVGHADNGGDTYLQYDRILEENIYYKGGYFTHDDFVKTLGTGVNFKAGIIFRPIGLLRLGFAVQTPTFYSMHDYYNQDIKTEDVFFPKGVDDNGDPVDVQNRYSETPVGESRYNLQTPLKLMGSAALVFGKVGLVSLEYEMVDYGMATLSNVSGATADFTWANSKVKERYGVSHGLKGGAELQLSRYFKLRGGAAYYTSPFKSGGNTKTGEHYDDLLSFSGGLGFRTKGFFMDLAYVYRTTGAKDYLYNYTGNISDVVDPIVSNTSNDNLINITFGLKF